MRKQSNYWFEVFGLVVALFAVAIFGISAVSVLQQGRVPLAAVMPSPPAVQTIVPGGTPAIDWIATRDAIKTLVP